jgi:phosphate uptake regulator
MRRLAREFEDLRLKLQDEADAVLALLRHSVQNLMEGTQASVPFDVLEERGHQIENAVAELIAMWQPVARDLRWILAMQKIHWHLVRLFQLLAQLHRYRPYSGADLACLTRLESILQRLLQSSMIALERNTAEDCSAALLLNRDYDSLCGALYSQGLSRIMEDRHGAELLVLAYQLGEIHEHAIAVAEEACFAVTGVNQPSYARLPVPVDAAPKEHDRVH